MALIELLNSDEFNYPCTWFEDSQGNQSNLMANRTMAAQHIPMNAHRMRIDGSIWVRGDDWLHQDIQRIYDALTTSAEYTVSIVNGTLFIQLSRKDDA